MSKEPRCPLCGAHLTAEELLDVAEEVLDFTQAVIGGHCPHCQGRLELMPGPERLDVGYLNAAGQFDTVLSMPLLEAAVERSDDETLVVHSRDQHWHIRTEE